jgi:hypothetical protein
MSEFPSADPYYEDPKDTGEIRAVRRTYDPWDDWFIVLVIWAGFFFGGWGVGWLLGA